ncbi:efflux RND transporter periplasmic adaptor subunit [Donghicola tyrosinivorans]|uniref:Membrane fusion protein (Multidrug efflux system) n=1 Tax=Donghicola tyrosinivorans TaxID=1652492 RepID=A0A2T0WFH6_9RHOB|nr:efflux RND transporter periplasmic adaptor subunit [Donghicola tyrosinivorans]PRY85415.1 membrane fusion protein (multidrug efflux system) [Donghicola tyrosinivorans]
MTFPSLPFRTVAAMACAGFLFSAGHAAAQQMPGSAGPSDVGVVALQTTEVPYTVTLPGRAVAFEQTDIRPRVEGTIEEIVYIPGHPLEVGDVLYRIEGDSYEAELAAAEAAVAGAEASVTAAKATLERYQKLDGVGVTRESVETAEVSLMQAEADQRSAEAALRTAQLNLKRTEITSPIQGVADVSEVSVGALVTANQSDALTTVTRLDPIYVDLTESSARLLRVREQIDAGDLAQSDKLQIDLTLENGATYSAGGTLVSPGFSVSSTTGAVEFRIQFDNPDRKILPGMFLRANIQIGNRNAILVPQRATTRSASGDLTAFVVKDGKAKKVVLTEAGSYQNAWVVTEGVADGDALVVDGLRNLRDGAEVAPTSVTIDENGVVQSAAAQTPAAE